MSGGLDSQILIVVIVKGLQVMFNGLFIFILFLFFNKFILCVKKILMEKSVGKEGNAARELILKYFKKRGQGICQVASCVYFVIERRGKGR